MKKSAYFAFFLVCVTTAGGWAHPGKDGRDLGLDTVRIGSRYLIRGARVVPLQDAAQAARVGRALRLFLKPDVDTSGLEEVSRQRLVVQVPSGEAVVLRLLGSQGIEVMAPDGRTPLGQKALAALDMAPIWVQKDLASNLSLMGLEAQDRLSDAFLAIEDKRLLDEVAFLMANSPPEELADPGFRPSFLLDNARLVYAADEALAFVRLVEKGDRTTAAYRYRDGEAVKEWEVSPDDYYWWVLHPRLDGEVLVDVDPSTGEPAAYPDGLSFREYVLASPYPPDSLRSYTRHYIFRKPPKYEGILDLDDVPYDSIANLGPSSIGAVLWPDKGPLEVTRDSKGRTTTIEFKVRPKGMVLATTLRVEAAYAEGRSDLLAHMVRYGAGNAFLSKWVKIFVVMTRPPFGKAGVIEDALASWGGKFEVVGPEWLANGDLSQAAKIIVPSDQPLEVYKAVSENRGRIEDWLRGPKWRIFELHGAASVDGDWSGLVMPGGFTGVGVASEPDDYVEVEGQPPFGRILEGTDIYWDGVKGPCLSGDRPLLLAMNAVDKATWWSSQNIFDSVIDFAEKHFGVYPERTSFAQRILYNHFGNCGEEQDMVTSALKALLIPAANTSNSCEDHVWSEFLFVDGWHPVAIGWSDGDACIADPAVAMGKKYGGGKNISFVVKDRGDGARIERTDLYADTGQLKVKVVDSEGAPVASATVLFVTESFYLEGDDFPLMIAHWAVTGDDGTVVVHPGANVQDPISDCKDKEKNKDLKCNNYYLRVITPFGSYPAAKGEVALAVDATEAVPGFLKEVTVKVNGKARVRRPEAGEALVDMDKARALSLTFSGLTRLACGRSLTADLYCDPVGEGKADVYAMDADAYAAFKDGKPFKVIASGEGVGSLGHLTVNPPASGDLFIAIVNQSAPAYELLVDAQVAMLAAPAMPEPAPEPVPPEPVPPEPGVVEEAAADASAGPPEVLEEAPSARGGGGCGAGVGSVWPVGLLALSGLWACGPWARRRDPV